MLVAVQGCSHGSLSAIYDSLAQYTSLYSRKVDLLLLCGDFQALRSVHDFPSLAVPPKYHALGTFHQYYSGEKVAPVLTLVIGGNHEASNYMWELYHGGWLAENIYYLGAAGSVFVDGLRVVGASGIYKDHDYGRGHHEKVPYNSSTLRSVYHIRSYDVAKLMQLQPRSHTIFLSHDWPITIPRHGDTHSLLRRKPFFRSEVETDTLGSPPLLALLRHVQPEHWFAAHLHVKFAAVYEHGSGTGASGLRPLANQRDDAMRNGYGSNSYGRDGLEQIGESSGHPLTESMGKGNPDEIAIDEFEEADVQGSGAGGGNPDEINVDDADFDERDPIPDQARGGNPDEILIEDDEFAEPLGASHLATPTFAEADPLARRGGIVESGAGPSSPRLPNISDDLAVAEAKEALQVDESADFVEAARAAGAKHGTEGVLGPSAGGGSDAAAIAAPAGGRSASAPTNEPATGSGLEPGPEAASCASSSNPPGRTTKFLALDKCGPGKDFIQFLDIPAPTPPSSTTTPPFSPSFSPRLSYDPNWLAITRALHPYLSTQFHQIPLPPPDQLDALISDELDRMRSEGLLVPSKDWDGAGMPEMVWEKGEVEIRRVQRFWPTAPAQGMPGGSPTAWYTNPQTEAFCGMLGIENKINPAPAQPPTEQR